MPNIAQQDYIIIDWEGKSADNAAKKAEVDAILKNMYLSNPLTLLSVVFKNYDVDIEAVVSLAINIKVYEEDDTVLLQFHPVDDETALKYSFDIE